MSRKITQDIFLCFLSAVLLIFSFPNYNLWFFAWFGFLPLFWAIQSKSKGRAFLLSYFTGIIFWTGTIYWLANVTLTGTVLLIVYLALYFGIFGLIFYFILLLAPHYALLFLPFLWIILECLRSHLFTGFPWALLGYSQYLNLPVIQIADFSGVWGVSFLVMMINVTIYKVISYKLWIISKEQKSVSIVKSFLLPLLILFLSLIYGYYKLNLIPPSFILPIKLKISVIQANIPQELKWRAGMEEIIITKYLDISRQAIEAKPDLVIWPEAAIPYVLEENSIYNEQVISFVKKIKIPLLFGAVRKEDKNYYNSAILISEKGKALIYDKLHLVPFGEYIPLRKIFGFLEKILPIGDFTPGREYTLFTLPVAGSRVVAKFAVLICFEDLFPKLSRQFVKRGADFLVNITNDAWFGRSAAAYQHLQASVFRAVENRVAVVRAANTGVSAFIAPSGKIISMLEIFNEGKMTSSIELFSNMR
ncbi:MAG: apolipoprotein N-acyltransferase [Candidatus Omnitrophica bacterium]|nr:apolipoprotein N-acyltransferase [Candidatus Omnitrophota bacterium]